MPATTLVYDPTAPFEDAPPAATSAAPGARLPSLRGAGVGFIAGIARSEFLDVVTPRGALYAFPSVDPARLPGFDDQRFAMALLERCGVKEVVRHRKPVASTPASAAIMADLVNRCDLVITGSGD